MKTTRGVLRLALLLWATPFTACSTDGPGAPPSPGATGSPKTTTESAASLSLARQIATANRDADHRFNLVTRKLLNNETEMVEFYEPQPGRILFSAAGSPVQASKVDFKALQGKSPSQIWTLVAPGEPVPAALAQAIARSANGAADAGVSDPTAAAPPVTPAAAANSVGPTEAVKAPAPVTSASGITNGAPVLRSGGYCAGQFWTDFGSWGAGKKWRHSATYNYGWSEQSFTNVTEAGIVVCPQGDLSGLGGRLSSTGSPYSGYDVPPNTYRWVTWTAGENCGYNLFCGGNRCTPNYMNIDMTFYSYCYLNNGTSCGDNFGMIAFYDWWDSFCNANGGSPCPRSGMLGCACGSGGTCDPGGVCFGNTCIACGGYSQSCCLGLTCNSGRTCQYSPAQNTYSCF